jgi:hypothetical protein
VNELGIGMLFATYHRELSFPYILKVKSDYLDVMVIGDYWCIRRVHAPVSPNINRSTPSPNWLNVN